MEFFYIIVLSIAVIFLILILTLIGILMKESKKKAGTFPPISNNCPDYWVMASDGINCTIPTKTISNGITNIEKNAGSLYGTGTGTTLDIKYRTSYNTNSPNYDAVTENYSFPIYTPGLGISQGSSTTPSSVLPMIDFKHAAWSAQGKTSTCAQKQWAQRWGITWDGITNNNTC